MKTLLKVKAMALSLGSIGTLPSVEVGDSAAKGIAGSDNNKLTYLQRQSVKGTIYYAAFLVTFFVPTLLWGRGVEAVEMESMPTTRFYVWASTGPRSYLTDAKVTIQDARGKLIARGKTNHRGIVGFRLLNRKMRQLPLRVQTVGGKIDGLKFNGKLKALSYDVGARKPIIYLDLVSTTAQKIKNPRLNYAAATGAVRNALSIIPRAPIDVLRVRNPYVDSGRLQLAIRTAGGWDRFVRAIARQAKQGRVMDGLKPTVASIKTPGQSTTSQILGDALNPDQQRKALVVTTSTTTTAPGSNSTLCTTATPGNENTVANYGFIATASLMEVVGVPMAAVDGVTGMLLSPLGYNDTSPATEALDNVASELDCISEQLVAIQDELNEIVTLIETATLQTELTNANSCASSVQTGWNLYQSLANGADGTINAQNPNLCVMNGSFCGAGDIATWQAEVTACGNSINNALFGTQGTAGGSAWAELNILSQGQYAWYTQAQSQALQSFLSYWGTTMYQQFVLQNEIYNFYGQWANAIASSGGNGTTGSTACAYGTQAGGVKACQWQSNVQFAFPGDLYSDEIGLWDGTAINAFPGGLTLSGSSKSTTSYNAGSLANEAWKTGGYAKWTYNFSAKNLVTNAQTAFNNQGINPDGNASGVETYASPQALRTITLLSTDVSALQNTQTVYNKSTNPNPLTASNFFFQAINQINGWPTSAGNSAAQTGYFTSDNVSTVSGTPVSQKFDSYESEVIHINSTISPSSQTVTLICFADFPTCTDEVSPPILAVLMGRTWWSNTSASNATNTSFYSILPAPSTVPNAPVLTSLTPGTGSIAVAFDSVPTSQDGGTPVTNYVASCSVGSGTPITANGTSSPVTVGGLTGGTAYNCSIQAQNAGGFSAIPNTCPIASCSAIPSLPTAPSLVSIYPGGQNTAQLNFTAPTANGGSAITTYWAECAPSGTSQWVYASGASSPLNFSNLADNLTYDCNVAAQNAAGIGAKSNTLQVTIPDAPQLVSVTSPGDNSAVLNFNPPVNPQVVPITGYISRCAPSGTTTWTYVSGQASPLTFTNLTPASTYTCEVAAQNATSGFGALSNSISVSIPNTGAPGAPTLTSVTSPDANSATLSFNAPINSGTSPITTYWGACAPLGTTSWIYVTGTASPLTFTSLTPGSTYTCEVAAQNAAGLGGLSNTLNITVSDNSVPGAPTLTSVTSSAPNSAVLAFTAPTPNGGAPVTTYWAECAPSGTTSWSYVSGSGSPLTFTNLTNGTAYTCGVAAQNAAGIGPVSSLATVTPVGPPLAPTLNSATAGTGQITLSFTASSNNGGSAITGFQGLCTPTAGGTTKSVTVNSATATSMAVTGLTKGTPYSCDVKTKNSYGSSASSNALTATSN